MDVQSLQQVNAPLAVSSMMAEARVLPQSEQKSSQQKIEDQATVKLTLSPSAQNLMSTGDTSGSMPVPPSDEAESNPSKHEEQNSRDAEERAGAKSQDLAKAFNAVFKGI